MRHYHEEVEIRAYSESGKIIYVENHIGSRFAVHVIDIVEG